MARASHKSENRYVRQALEDRLSTVKEAIEKVDKLGLVYGEEWRRKMVAHYSHQRDALMAELSKHNKR